MLSQINKKTITITLIKAGKILKTSMAKIEDSIPKTTDRILHHFTNFEVLPSRIILFDDKENEHLIQEFINHSFSKSLPFYMFRKSQHYPVHLPLKRLSSAPPVKCNCNYRKKKLKRKWKWILFIYYLNSSMFTENLLNCIWNWNDILRSLEKGWINHATIYNLTKLLIYSTKNL